MKRNRWVLWPIIATMSLAGCAIGPGPDPVPGRPDRVSIHSAIQVLSLARDQMGAPYRYGGSDPSGFDCSGLVRYVHEQIGVWVPRTVREQHAYARSVPFGEIRAGDLVFFDIDGGKGRHVGIYEGRGRFIHAPSSGKRVTRASVHNPYWRARLVGVGRYLW